MAEEHRRELPPNTPSIIEQLVDSSNDTSIAEFRTESISVGQIYSMNYDTAIVAVYDYDRELAGGLPKGGFLFAATSDASDTNFILLRILGDTRLPSSNDNDVVRQKSIERSANEKPWPEDLDPWIKTQVSLHGIECRVLGTFDLSSDSDAKFSEDIDNHYSINQLMVWKPGPITLKTIVNHRHRNNGLFVDVSRARIGKTRFAAAEKPDSIKSEVLLDPTDMLKRRTVYLGMSRSGKSNAMKLTAAAIYKLREGDANQRIGQLIFDPNGEYAQDNQQDGKGLHKVYEALGLQRSGEVETYGLFAVPSDEGRRIMKINFYGDPLPIFYTADNRKKVEIALEQLLAGREVIQVLMSDETARYTTAFRDADLAPPLESLDDKGSWIRYRRSVLAYQAALFSSGLDKPSWKPNIQRLFSKAFLKSLKEGSKSKGTEDLSQAVEIITDASSNNGEITWEQAEVLFKALNRFINGEVNAYEHFNRNYISDKKGEAWAGPRLKNLLRIFYSENGPRSFQRAGIQHSSNSSKDFAEQIIEDLSKGKLVIVDQSTGDPNQNRKAAERIMWKIFDTQQEKFRNSVRTGSTQELDKHILVYLEEAHNLLPKARAQDNLSTVWARSAKEGSKMNIGMVLATQAPSSIMPEILSETDNWILAYLNSKNERNVVSGYMDFEDFEKQIGQVSEPGFVRIRTLSLPYTIPIQFEKFSISEDH